MARDENQISNWNRFWSYPRQNEKLSCSKKRIIEILVPLLNGREKILDAGCGSGFFSRFFVDSQKTVYSVDNSAKALELCRQNTTNRTIVKMIDLTKSPPHILLNTKFDLIFSDGLLEHFSLPLQIKIIENFRDSLSSKGLVVTFVPNVFSPWQLIRPFFMPGITETPFTLRRLNRLHERTGMQVRDSGGINVIPFTMSPEKLLGNKFGMLLYSIAAREQ